MQHEQRQNAVEAVIRERQRAGVSDLEDDSRIAIAARGVFDVRG
jgi:hypothetical protein